MSVLFYTQAYNAELTLARAMDSVLAQTDPGLAYYICDNGSTDGTRSIILDYASRDNRIKVFLRDTNDRSYKPLYDVLSSVFISEKDRYEYFVDLDADDEYAIDFLEKMLPFANVNNLDVASCCSHFIDRDTGKNVGVFTLSEDIIVADNEFGTKFPEYFKYRALWGKLISIDVLMRVNFSNVEKLCEDNKLIWNQDVALVFAIIIQAKRIGVLSKLLHTYYISQNSASFSFLDERFESDRGAIKVYRNFLTKKVGKIEDKNEQFIAGVHIRTFRSAVRSVFSTDWTIEKKLSTILEAIHDKETQAMIAIAPLIDREKLIETMGECMAQDVFSHESTEMMVYKGIICELTIQ